MKHIYLSPHLDDAVLSCGAAIHRRATAGEPVQVLTLFAGEAGVEVKLSPFARLQHGYWGDPPRPMALRRAEDAAALTLLGAAARRLDYLDAIYRTDAEGRWMYLDLDTLFGEVHPGDPMGRDGAQGLAERLAGLLPPAEQAAVYAPLGVGRHVDHQLVHAAARRLGERGYRLAFYEDYPYAEEPGALDAALAAAGAEHWRRETIPLDPADLAAQVSALGYYRSQMAILFGGAEAMPNRVWIFAAACSPEASLAEALWRP